MRTIWLASITLAGCARHVAPIEPLARVAAPSTSTPVSACWIEFARSGAFTASGIAVRHPSGTVLVDAGQSLQFREEIREIPRGRFYLKLVPGALVPDRPAADVLRAANIDPSEITWFVPTHAHSDHIGGLMDLPDVPIRLHPAERELIVAVEAGTQAFNVIPAHARRLSANLEAITFLDEPYEVFARHADLLGDGSIEVVPLEGHTPGSIGVVIDIGSGRLMYAGDAINEVSQLDRLRGKSPILARTDADGEDADHLVALLAELRRSAGITVLPAHERAAWVTVFGAPGACVGGPR